MTDAQTAPGLRGAIDEAQTARVAAEYFDAIARHDVEAAVACWKPGGRENVRGQVDTTAPDGVRDFLTGILAPFPDLRFEVLETTVQDDRACVRWEATGTFTGVPFQGVEPTGSPLRIEGVDVVIVHDGKIIENNAYADGMSLARQLGLMPPDGSKAEQAMKQAFNARTKAAAKLGSAPVEEVADGVWLLRGGFPGKTMNVYLLKDGEGVMLFDAGVRSMTNAVAAAGAELGGITRVLLGHGHPDHRGTAPFLGVPVLCHEAEKADAEADGGAHYFHYERLNPLGKVLMPRLLVGWDGGPVTISQTVTEGDEIAGFRVIHLPGHAPGMIGLWRESDRVALTSDCFYTLDPQTGLKGRARVPHAAFNEDTEQARASMLKLAALEPAAAWPGHADPLRGDVKGLLETAAATT
ncbi:MAG: ester cyclase [Solirubrobacteraceae bacterium]|jgi:glyoxylase-like metal-dependent hydrolase (beta-lactamase superfamily II)/predicted ester cyclase|nr:ester cyclase [Solirubrobacteraceae bacterium]MCU0312644.1 ester cyclase [Solirubrobacteraceae bacterium]